MEHVSGLKLRVPLAGMPKMRGIRGSGEVPLKPWQHLDTPPSTWLPPAATFDEPARQGSLARLLLLLKPLPHGPAHVPHVEDAMAAVEHGGGWSAEELKALKGELALIESQAQARAQQLGQIRKRLHEVAFGELGIRTRRSDDQPPGTSGSSGKDAPSTAAAASFNGPAYGTPATAEAHGDSGSTDADAGGETDTIGAGGAADGSSGDAVDGISTGRAPSAGGEVACVRLRLRGAPPCEFRATDGAVGDDGAAPAASAARRAAQAAMAKAAAAEAKAREEMARRQAELGEAAEYVVERHKPATPVNMRQFWALVGEYLRPPAPLPHDGVARVAPPPEHCPLVDRLVAALLPCTPATAAVPAAAPAGAGADANSAAATNAPDAMADAAAAGARADAALAIAGPASADAAQTAAEAAPADSDAAPTTALASPSDGAPGGTGAAAVISDAEMPPAARSAAAADVDGDVTSASASSSALAVPDAGPGIGTDGEAAERRLRQEMRALGLLREAGEVGALQPDPVGEELRRQLRKLHKLASRNAATRAALKCRAQAEAATLHKVRLEAAIAASVQHRFLKTRKDLAKMRGMKGRKNI